MTSEEQLEVWVKAHPQRLRWFASPNLRNKGWSVTARAETGVQRTATAKERERACEMVLGMLKALGCA